MARGELHVQLYIHYADDEKFEEVSRSSRLLYVDSLCLAKELLNDGEISPAKVHKLMYPESKRAAVKAAAELVDAGLWQWDEKRKTYTITAWLKRNKSRSQVEEDRHKAEEASRVANHKRWHVARNEPDPKCSLCVEEAPRPPSGSGSDSGSVCGQRSESTETETETETKNKEQPPKPPAPSRRAPEPPADHDGEPGPAEELVAVWINSCNRRPSRHVVDDIGRLVAEMLQDDIPPADISRGIQLWQARGSNPRTLPSFVNQVMNAAPSNVVAIGGRLQQRPSTTDQRVGTALELAAKFAEEDLA